MKRLILGITCIFNVYIFGQIIYVDNNDAVYPWPSSNGFTYNFDINNDGVSDIRFQTSGSGGSYRYGWFIGINSISGQNKINSSSESNSIPTIDCSGSTLNSMSNWKNKGTVYANCCNSVMGTWETSVGIGSHKQGFRLIMVDPINGALGYKYGYVNYSLTPSGDLIIHDWYYQNTFNVPIIANSQLQYPYDENCIYYDTVVINDTIVTNVYDTIVTNVYDTIYVSTTDTLFINTVAALNEFNINIKIYPNPSSEYITIDNGNYELMNGYSIVIKNNSGQVVFQSLINQQYFNINLSTWGGDGLYYLDLIDTQGNIIQNKKIIKN